MLCTLCESPYLPFFVFSVILEWILLHLEQWNCTQNRIIKLPSSLSKHNLIETYFVNGFSTCWWVEGLNVLFNLVFKWLKTIFMRMVLVCLGCKLMNSCKPPAINTAHIQLQLFNIDHFCSSWYGLKFCFKDLVSLMQAGSSFLSRTLPKRLLESAK